MRKLICAAAIVIVGQLQSVWADDEHNIDLIDDTDKHDGRAASVGDATETKQLGELLDAFYSSCGRYPKTSEGLRALVTKPKNLKCKKWGIQSYGGLKPYLSAVPRGWKYISEKGVTYKLERQRH